MIVAHGIAGNDVLAKPGGKRPGGAISRLLARDNNQAGTRVSCPERRDHQRPGALPHGEGGVIAAAQLVEERNEFGRREQLARDPVDKHEGNSLVQQRDMQSGPHGKHAGSWLAVILRDCIRWQGVGERPKTPPHLDCKLGCPEQAAPEPGDAKKRLYASAFSPCPKRVFTSVAAVTAPRMMTMAHTTPRTSGIVPRSRSEKGMAQAE